MPVEKSAPVATMKCSSLRLKELEALEKKLQSIGEELDTSSVNSVDESEADTGIGSYTYSATSSMFTDQETTTRHGKLRKPILSGYSDSNEKKLMSKFNSLVRTLSGVKKSRSFSKKSSEITKLGLAPQIIIGEDQAAEKKAKKKLMLEHLKIVTLLVCLFRFIKRTSLPRGRSGERHLAFAASQLLAGNEEIGLPPVHSAVPPQMEKKKPRKVVGKKKAKRLGRFGTTPPGYPSQQGLESESHEETNAFFDYILSEKERKRKEGIEEEYEIEDEEDDDSEFEIQSGVLF